MSFQILFSQEFTRKDSLQGGFSFERNSYDMQRYDLNITVNPEKRSVVGYNDITFKIVKNTLKTEEVLSNTGDKKMRTFTVIKALKN